MRLVNITQYEKVGSNDINNLQSGIHQAVFDDTFYAIFGLSGAISTSFTPAYVSALVASLSSGIGFYYDPAQTGYNPKYRMISSLGITIPVTFTAAHASLDRIDLVCLAPNLIVTATAQRYVKTGGTGPITLTTVNKNYQDSHTLQVVAGTPGASPTAPALPAGYISIAQVRIHAATGMTGQSDITDTRTVLTFNSASTTNASNAGHTYAVGTNVQSQLDQLDAAVKGHLGEGSNGTTVLDPSVSPYYVVPASIDGGNLHVQTSKGPAMILLPSASLLDKLTIHDVDGMANVNPITLGILPCYALGSNSNGQAGGGLANSNQPTSKAFSSPVLVQAMPLASLAVNSTAGFFLDKNGLIWSVGAASSGQLANFSSTLTSSSPVMVAYVSGATMVAAGGTNGYALGAQGKVWAWGLNTSGQVGDNSILSRSQPTLVLSSASSFTMVVAGALHAGVLANTGSGLFWGDNTFGQVGDGTVLSRSTPVAVLGGLSFKQVGAGASFSFGLTSAGLLYVWGLNTSGQIGDNTVVTKSSPIAVLGGQSFTTVVAGSAHLLGMTPTGTVYGWGLNSAGQVGDNSILSRSTPVLLAGGRIFTAIAAGKNISAAVDTSSNVYVWGSNANGVIGLLPPTTAGVSTPTLVSGMPAFASLFMGSNSDTLIGMVNQGFYSIEGLSSSFVCSKQNGRWKVYSDGTNYWLR